MKIEPPLEEMVNFDTFSKADYRTVKIETCEIVPKSKKILKFTLDDGSDKTHNSKWYPGVLPAQGVGWQDGNRNCKSSAQKNDGH